MCVWGGAQVSQWRVCGCQTRTCRHRFSPSILCVLGVELKTSFHIPPGRFDVIPNVPGVQGWCPVISILIPCDLNPSAQGWCLVISSSIFFHAPKHFEVCDCQQQYPEGPLESVRAHLLSFPFLDFRFPQRSFPNVYFWIIRCACFSLQQRRNGPLSHILGWMLMLSL